MSQFTNLKFSFSDLSKHDLDPHIHSENFSKYNVLSLLLQVYHILN